MTNTVLTAIISQKNKRSVLRWPRANLAANKGRNRRTNDQEIKFIKSHIWIRADLTGKRRTNQTKSAATKRVSKDFAPAAASADPARTPRHRRTCESTPGIARPG